MAERKISVARTQNNYYFIIRPPVEDYDELYRLARAINPIGSSTPRGWPNDAIMSDRNGRQVFGFEANEFDGDEGAAQHAKNMAEALGGILLDGIQDWEPLCVSKNPKNHHGADRHRTPQDLAALAIELGITDAS